MENTKICSKCGRELPLDCFSKCKSNKDGLFCWCKECHKQYSAEHNKQYRAEHKEEIAKYSKKYYAEHNEERKQYYAEWYASIEGYVYMVRWRNLREDRKYGRCGKDEDLLPPLEYYIEKFTKGIDYYDGKKYPFNELGFDRIDDSKPHTIDNIVVATTEHNIDRWHKRMTVEEYKAYIQTQNELELVL